MNEEDIKRGCRRRVPLDAYRNEAWLANFEQSILREAGAKIIDHMTPGKWFTVRYDLEWRPYPDGYGDMEIVLAYKINAAIVEKLRVVETDYASMPPSVLALTAVDELHRRMQRCFSWWRRYTLPKRTKDFIRAVAPWHYAEEDARKDRIWQAIKDKVK